MTTKSSDPDQVEIPVIALKPCPFCGSAAVLIEGEECAVATCVAVKTHRLFVDGDNNAAEEVAAFWNSRVKSQVNLLIWSDDLDGPRAETLFGAYNIWRGSQGKYVAFLRGYPVSGSCSTEDEAKSVAQADFERRVHAALVG